MSQERTPSVGASTPHPNGSGRSLRIFAVDPNSKSASLLMTAFNAANLRYRMFRACQGLDLTLEIGESEVEKSHYAHGANRD